MLEFKPLPLESIPEALEKARHYRLLNEPWQAESICRDILRADPDNQEVIYTLILSMTDQFDRGSTSFSQALELTSKLTERYQSEYCRGLIFERRAIATYKRQTPGNGFIAYSHFEQAMKHFENAEQVQPRNNNDAILRWNACVRFVKQYKLRPSPEEWVEPLLDV